MATFRRWFAGLTEAALNFRNRPRAPRRRARLALETLEDRAVPAALVTPGIETDYVRSLYVEVLGRAGSDAEVAGYVADFRAGRTPDGVAAAFLGSVESHGRRVGQLYQDVLGRPADAGSQGFVDLLQRGGSEREVLAGLLNSAEYNAQHADDASFIGGLYEDALGRTPSAGEVASYQGRLASGLSRSELVGAFLSSPERARLEVNGLFTLYLGRAADEPSLANMATAVAQGSSSLSQIAVTIVSSAENQMQAISAATTPAATPTAAPTAVPPTVTPPAVTPPAVTPPSDTTPPSVQGGVSVNSTTVRVTFSEDVADSAADPAGYQITQQGAALQVVSARFAGSKHVVELTTAEQNDGQYSVKVSGVTDVAGNAISGAAATFTGIPSPVDTDGDGISDFLERRGYQITVTAADGTQTQRQVTNDPTKADTDGDGLSDSREKTLGTDPTAADTDADGLSDRAEVTPRTVTIVAANGSTVSRQVTSDPTKADSDADGLTDAQEAGRATDPSAADTDADGVSDDREVGLGTDPTKADTDADDLTDGEEVAGWDVTVTKLNGAVLTRHVTSDPTKPDTDADGLDDRHEKTLGTDPRAGDTDADTLADRREVTQTRTDPTNQDSDGDGIDDGTQANQVAPTPPAPADVTPPRVLSVTSTANDKVLVTFNEPMGPSALVLTNYVIQQQNVNAEAGGLSVTAARFTDASNSAVELTTRSQNELIYAVTIAGAADRAGNPLAASTRVNFPGTPPAGVVVDGDLDGLPDNVEQRGWVVTVRLLDGTMATRQVTSDPTKGDTDGDGLGDARELALLSDPRAIDTDADGLTDATEVNRYRSSPTRQDTDGDVLDDAREVNVLFTSPLLADTDGDQINDDRELLGNRNPRVSDLPTPRIDVGDVSLKLNVKLTATSAQGSRDLETKEARSVLENNSSRENSQVSEVTNTFAAKLGSSQSFNMKSGVTGVLELSSGFSGSGFGFGFSQEFTNTTANRNTFTNVSRQETKRALTNARTTTKEVTATETVVRTVDAARIDTTLDLTNLSDVAYRIRNLQVTALMTDPRDPTSLVPIATLTPEVEPADGFVLGPLTAAKGPILMTSRSVFPSLVESLMANPEALIFRISNYDVIVGEGPQARNFAFSSQDVVERTASLTLDFSGALRPTDDPQASALGVEVHRVATSAGRVISGARTAYGADGAEAGVTLREALSAIGLTGYQIRRDATDKVLRDAAVQVRYFDGAGNQVSLTPEQISNSYATFQAVFEDGRQVERFYRIRDRAVVEGQPEAWEVITDTGIDRTLGPDAIILKAGTSATLAFVRDEDGDFLPSGLEDFYGTSDSPTSVGADFAHGTTPTLTDNLFLDALVLGNIAPDDPRFATGSRVWVSATGGGLTTGTDYFLFRFPTAPQAFLLFTSQTDALQGSGPSQVHFTDKITATIAPAIPRGRDTDSDGLDDRFEALIGWDVNVAGIGLVHVQSSPTSPDTDGDGLSDSDEAPAGWTDSDGDGLRDKDEVFRQGPNDYVTNPLDPDTDRDLLSDKEEVTGVNIFPIDTPTTSTVAFTDPTRADTDSDGVSDGLEKLFGLNPADGLDVDSDADGLPDRVEIHGWLAPYETVTETPLEVKPGGQFRAEGFDPAAGLVPLLTRLDRAFVILNANFPTGTRVRVDATGGGLTAGVDYFLNNRGGNAFEFYAFKELAQAASEGVGGPGTPGIVALTSNVTAKVIPLGLLRVRPSTIKVDTDGDGLTDFEEYRAKTDPTSVDSDRDGISDFDELNGFKLPVGRDQTPITTNPLDADTDNDGLSDGEEAEIDLDQGGNRIDRGFASRWIVSVAGEDPRRVFTHPRDPDADFDGLPDGAEKYQVVKDAAGRFTWARDAAGNRVFQGADPTKANTDGDSTNDYQEVIQGSSPVLKQFTVTIGISYLQFKGGSSDKSNDGEEGDAANTPTLGAGEIRVNARVEGPGYSGTFFETSDYFLQPDSSRGVSEGQTERFNNIPSERNIRATLMVGLDQSFTLEALLEEYDFLLGVNDKMQVFFGGSNGVAVKLDGASKPGAISGFDLDALFKNASQSSVSKELVFDFEKSDNSSPLVNKTAENQKMAGKLVFSMTVTR